MIEGRALEPVSKDSVAVLFSDIVGFTTLCSSMPPAKVANMLQRLFRKFDGLAQVPP